MDRWTPRKKQTNGQMDRQTDSFDTPTDRGRDKLRDNEQIDGGTDILMDGLIDMETERRNIG